MPRKPKKPKPPIRALPDELCILKNKDKPASQNETWKEGHSLAKFPHPCRILFLGFVSRGKTNTIKNVFLKH